MNWCTELLTALTALYKWTFFLLKRGILGSNIIILRLLNLVWVIQVNRLRTDFVSMIVEKKIWWLIEMIRLITMRCHLCFSVSVLFPSNSTHVTTYDRIPASFFAEWHPLVMHITFMLWTPHLILLPEDCE